MPLSTIQILSSQYEISSQLSPKLGLLGLIETFSRTVIRRYPLKNVHVYLENYTSKRLEKSSYNHQGFSIISNNTVNLSDAFHDHMIKQYSALQGDSDYQQGSFDAISIHNYLILKIGALGFMTLETNGQPLEAMQVRSLISIKKILGDHISACIEKEALRQSHDKIYKQLYFNELTRLPNRKGLFKVMAECNPHDDKLMSAVLFNIKEFGLINHQYGYPLGDKILKRIARELENEFGEAMVYHIGPDEFLTLHNISDWTRPIGEEEKKVTKVKASIRNKTLEEDNICVDLWSSSHHNSTVNETAAEKLNALEFAMSLLRSKRQSLNLIIDDKTREQFKMDHTIHTIMANDLPFNQFNLVFQPQYDMTGQIIAAETLIRWKHPKLGYIPPDKFIPLLEANQKIVDLDRFVLEQSLVAMSLLKTLTASPPKIAINVSGHSFVSDVFYKDIIENLDEQSKIVLELTESAKIFDLEHIAPVFLEFIKRGIEIHLDDFGTGYSSISYLMSLQFGMLKVDKSFISHIDSDKNKQRIVKSIVSLAKSCDLEVLVEGVETKNEFKTCVSLGVSKFQGYYFSRPVSFSDFVKLIQNQDKPQADKGDYSSTLKSA